MRTYSQEKKPSGRSDRKSSYSKYQTVITPLSAIIDPANTSCKKPQKESLRAVRTRVLSWSMIVLGWNLPVSAWQATMKTLDIERKKEKIEEKSFHFLGSQIIQSRDNQAIRILP